MLGAVKAIVISRPGGEEVLEIRELPDPLPGSDEVLVRVRACALNRADLLQRRGLYPAPPGCPPDIPGLELAGEVARCGPAAVGLEPGDRVMGIVGGGAQAELATLHARACIPVPDGISWEEAAAIPEAFLTAYDALFTRGNLAAGESVLLHAAGSGVGTAALQLASVAGARVIALSRTPEKRARLEALGACTVLDPGAEGIAGQVRAALGGRGIDVILGLLGASSWPLDMELVAERGRLVLVGTLGGSKVEADLSLLMRKRVTLVGTVLRTRALEEKIALAQEFTRRIVPLFEDGRLRAVVDRVLPLEQVREAHRLLASDATFGKIVLRVD